MYRCYKSADQLKDALAIFQRHPRLKVLENSTILTINNVVPSAEFRLYSCNDSKIWIGIKPFMGSTHIFVNGLGQLDEQIFIPFFKHVLRENTDTLLANPHSCLIGDIPLVDSARAYLRGIGHNLYSSSATLLYCFRKDLQFPEYKLPEGFTMGPFCEEDVPTVAATWQYKSPTEEQKVRMRMKHLATVCIKRASDGKPAGFFMLEHNGMLVHAFVVPEFRGLRLREALFFSLGDHVRQKFGIEPYFCTVKTNEVMFRWLKKDWEVYDETGAVASVDFQAFETDEALFKKIG
ncbi:unnamed protein product, partial [Mesorhabditis spiculigera]